MKRYKMLSLALLLLSCKNNNQSDKIIQDALKESISQVGEYRGFDSYINTQTNTREDLTCILVSEVYTKDSIFKNTTISLFNGTDESENEDSLIIFDNEITFKSSEMGILERIPNYDIIDNNSQKITKKSNENLYKLTVLSNRVWYSRSNEEWANGFLKDKYYLITTNKDTMDILQVSRQDTTTFISNANTKQNTYTKKNSLPK